MDETKCNGVNCKDKWHCYRFVSNKGNIKSFAEFNYTGKCNAQIKQKCEYCGTDKSGIHKLSCPTIKQILI